MHREKRWYRRRVVWAVLGSVAVVGGIAWLASLRRPMSYSGGFHPVQFTDRDGKAHNYRIFLPFNYSPDQQYPCLLFLNGLGENGEDGFPISNNLGAPIWEMKRTFPMIGIFPQCPKGEEWRGKTLQRAIDFADEVIEEYGGDSDRLFLTGVSSGGTAAWRALEEYPDRFAAALILCGQPTPNFQRVSDSKIPIWNHWNSGDDKEGLVEGNRQTHAGLVAAGASPVSSEYNGKGHNCWDRVYRSPFVFQWLLEHRLSDRVGDKLKLFRPLTAEEILKGWRNVGQREWEANDERLSVVGTAGGSRNDGLVADFSANDFEFAAEVSFSEEAQGFRMGLVDASRRNDAPQLVAEVICQLPECGRSGVRTRDGKWAAAGDPIAMRQLSPDFDNSISLRWHSGQCVVHVNGAMAVAWEGGAAVASAVHVSPMIFADPGTSWKRIRVREWEPTP